MSNKLYLEFVFPVFFFASFFTPITFCKHVFLVFLVAPKKLARSALIAQSIVFISSVIN